MNKPNFLCDMHCHTTRSDGLCTPKELIDLAGEAGMKVVTISDHDIVAPKTVDIDGKEVDIEKYALSKGVHLLRAMEFSCDTDVDDVHIVVFGLDWNNEKLKEVIEDIKRSKIESYREFLDKVNAWGCDITLEEVLNYGGQKRTEDEIQKKPIFNLMAEKGYTKDWSESKILSKTLPELQVRRRKPNPINIIKVAHEAGGIAILAHPYLIKDNPVFNGEVITREEYIQNLIDAGLDGIEAEYTYDKTCYEGDMTKEEIIAKVKKDYTDKVDIISGGSDFHGDHKKNPVNPRYIGECGIDFDYFMSKNKLKKLIKEN